MEVGGHGGNEISSLVISSIDIIQEVIVILQEFLSGGQITRSLLLFETTVQISQQIALFRQNQ